MENHPSPNDHLDDQEIERLNDEDSSNVDLLIASMSPAALQVYADHLREQLDDIERRLTGRKCPPKLLFPARKWLRN